MLFFLLMAQLMSMICSAHMLYNHRICWFRMYSGRFWFDPWHRVVQDFKTGSLNMSLTESIPVYFTTYLAECTIHSPSCLVYFVFVSYLAQQCIPHTCKMSEPILNFSSKFILWARISTLTEGFLTSWFNLGLTKTAWWPNRTRWQGLRCQAESRCTCFKSIRKTLT